MTSKVIEFKKTNTGGSAFKGSNSNNNSINITSNYDITLDRCSADFAKLDHDDIIKRFHLDHNEEYLFLNMLSRPFRINRNTGLTEYYSDMTDTWIKADFNSALTIFDILGESKRDAVLSGKFTTLGGVKNFKAANSPDYKYFSKHFDSISDHFNKFPSIFEGMKGIPEGVGDISYKLPLFDFFPIIIQMWDKDDEFPMSVSVLWDENLFDFMKFETSFYALGYFLTRVKEEINKF